MLVCTASVHWQVAACLFFVVVAGSPPFTLHGFITTIKQRVEPELSITGILT